VSVVVGGGESDEIHEVHEGRATKAGLGLGMVVSIATAFGQKWLEKIATV
jgi:hypothetical protein